LEDHVTTTIETPEKTEQLKELALRSIQIMEDGSREDFDEVLHPNFLNHEAKDEPPAARERGPAGAHATALWLRNAFGGLRWEIHEVVAEGDLVAVHCTMNRCHRLTPHTGHNLWSRLDNEGPA
jgi:ketosteroid isomerase-like protein